LSNFVAKSEIPLRDQTVIWWGGLRGSVSIALALSVAGSVSVREEIIATVFGVVLFTLLVQGLTTKPLLEKLHLVDEQPLRKAYLESVARQVALNRVLEHLAQSENRIGIEPEFYRYQETLIKGELNRLQTEIDKIQNEYPNLQKFTSEQLREELLAVEADTYAEFVKTGWLNKELAPFLQHTN
jgi:CPA1 family monovalent cation:H+ antiporter